MSSKTDFDENEAYLTEVSEESEESEKSEELEELKKVKNKPKKEDRVDDFLAFKKMFMNNIRIIARKTMIHTMGEVDKDLLDANICWLIADAVMHVLVIGDEIDNFNGDINQYTCSVKYRNVDALKLFLRSNLDMNRIIRIFTVSCDKKKNLGDDHWFIVIGSEQYAYLIEWGKKGETTCHVWEKMRQSDFIQYMMNMMVGQVKDRFYGSLKPHTVKSWAFDRKPLSAKTIIDYL